MAEGNEPQPYSGEKFNVGITVAQGITLYDPIAQRIGNLVIISGLIYTSSQISQNSTLFILTIAPKENFHALFGNYDCTIQTTGALVANSTMPAGYYAFNASFFTN